MIFLITALDSSITLISSRLKIKTKLLFYILAIYQFVKSSVLTGLEIIVDYLGRSILFWISDDYLNNVSYKCLVLVKRSFAISKNLLSDTAI